MNDEHDLLAARISGWLSGELDPPASRAVGRLVDRDAEARRLAGGYHRVDTIVRDWYEAVGSEPVPPVVVPQRASAPVRWRQLAMAAALLLLAVPLSRIDTAQAVERLFDAAAERIDADAGQQRSFAPTAYWELRAESFRQLPGGRTAACRPAADPAAG